jgi:hypothetical protein
VFREWRLACHRLKLYLILMVFLAPGLGIWGMLIRAPHDIDSLPESNGVESVSKTSCERIDLLLLAFSCAYVAMCSGGCLCRI